jgi:hypothetical protein
MGKGMENLFRLPVALQDLDSDFHADAELMIRPNIGNRRLKDS